MNEIVRVTSERCHELAALNKQLIEDEGHANPMDLPELAERMQTWLETEYACYALEDEGRLVAYSLWRDDGDYYYLRQLFTRRDARRNGYASALLDHLEREVYNDKPIRLEVLAGNGGAKVFYEKLGYALYCHTMSKPATATQK